MEIVPDFKNFLKPGHSKMLVPGDEKIIAEFCSFLKKELEETGRAVIFTSKPYFLEVMPAACGKGEAIAWLSDYLKLDQSKTMAFGDSMNDEQMIKMCGFGVAMQNALDYIKEQADFITEKDNNHDGISDFLEKYVL